MCIVMELCEGGNLYDQIEVKRDQEESIPENKVLQMAAQLLEGLRYLHERKIVHRGIRPSSILLTSDKNLKFGEIVSKAENRTYFSARNIQVESYDERRDIFQLGCVLYFVCAFVHPFEANDDKEEAALRRSEIVWTKRIVDFSYKRIPETYSNELNDIIARMLFQTNQTEQPTAQNLLKEVMEHLSSKQPVVRETLIHEMEQVQRGSRIAVKSQDQVSGPHEVEDFRVDTLESHRGLLNEKADQSQHSYEDAYQYTGPFMNKKSSIRLNGNERALYNSQEIDHEAPGVWAENKYNARSDGLSIRPLLQDN